MAPVLAVVSPHLDDSTLSCARLLALHPGSHVVTALAGGPATVDPIPEWELASGVFGPGDDVVGTRRAEDRAAAEMLGATVHHLELWDRQYREERYGYHGPVDGEELTAALAAAIEKALVPLGADAWFMPAGLVHPDHELTAAACRRAFGSAAAPDCYAYLELPYHLEAPAAVEAARARLRADRFDVQPEALPVSDDVELKRAAVACHRSQLAPLAGRIDPAVEGPETYFRLTKGRAR
jgi:LmbE family N-acetylglucosaminyl deacetylase